MSTHETVGLPASSSKQDLICMCKQHWRHVVDVDMVALIFGS